MPDFPTWWPAALAGLAAIAAFAFATWLASLVRRDVSLVDRMWSVMIASAAFVYGWQLAADATRAAWLLGLVGAWALRLAGYITRRNWGHGEDRRYQAIRARNQPNFAAKSLYLVFALQAVLAWLVSAPTLVALAGTRAFGALDAAGLLLAAAGLLFETIGDAQMSHFKSLPGEAGRVMDRGLWRYTRHPNYFGEVCFWWGVWLVALGAAGAGGAWSVASPIVMTVLLLKVSGVAMLEKDIGERRPEYRDYVARTNAFFPGPPRRRGPK